MLLFTKCENISQGQRSRSNFTKIQWLPVASL